MCGLAHVGSFRAAAGGGGWLQMGLCGPVGTIIHEEGKSSPAGPWAGSKGWWCEQGLEERMNRLLEGINDDDALGDEAALHVF